MCILKGFSRFVVCIDVQDGFAFKPFFLNTTASRKVILFPDTSAVNLGWDLLA